MNGEPARAGDCFALPAAAERLDVEGLRVLRCLPPEPYTQSAPVRLEQARAIVDLVVREAPGAVSVFVADTHGELVAAATMDGAAPDTRLNAQRKAYTAARSDARSTRELAEKVREDAVERASFDPFFTFFLCPGGPPRAPPPPPPLVS